MQVPPTERHFGDVRKRKDDCMTLSQDRQGVECRLAGPGLSQRDCKLNSKFVSLTIFTRAGKGGSKK